MGDTDRGENNQPPAYLASYVIGRRADGGWLCIHGAPLEICSTCCPILDRRYEMMMSKKQQEASGESS